MNVKWVVVGFVLGFLNGSFAEKIQSPDGHLSLSFELKSQGENQQVPSYNVSYKGNPLMAPSFMGFELGDGSFLKDHFTVLSSTIDSVDQSWVPVYGERSTVENEYTQLRVKLLQKTAPGYPLEIIFRCYNSGVAFCYHIPKVKTQETIEIKRELSEFNFLDNHTAWCTSRAQGQYQKKTINAMGGGVERPLTLQLNDQTYVAIAEARLVDYARMKLKTNKQQPNGIVSDLTGSVKATLPLITPWRVIMVAESPGALLENNDLILNLNDPCAIKDPSWIKPGKVIREVTLTTQGGKACIDYAQKHNLQYIEFDAGWYGHEYSKKSDATTVTVDPKRSPGPLDLPEIIRYAKDRDIGIILYINRLALLKQLDEVLPLYQSWGIAGLKYGFVDVGNQKATTWLHQAVRKAADHHLMVDVHDEYRPTGYSRTYPNLMTQEGIAGDETSPSNQQTLTILFTRMLAGAADNTICYYDTRVDEKASHAYQLAKSVCLYSPWQFIYWYDRPKESPQSKGGAGGQMRLIGDDPELEFWDHMPTVWDDTRVLHGRIGEYAVVARRSGAEWFVGCMNAKKERTLEVSLDFLEPSKKYVAHIYSDDPRISSVTNVKIDRYRVTPATVLKVKMSAKGGQAIHIIETQKDETHPLY